MRSEIPVRQWPLIIAAGLVVAVVHTMFPLAVYVLALGIALVRAGLRGLPPSERRVLATLIAVAIAVRLLAIALVFFANLPYHHDQWLGAATGDEAYGMSRALRARDMLLGAPINKYDAFIVNDRYGANVYITLLTIVQVMFGPTPYGTRLLNALAFLAGAILLFRATRSAFGSRPAFTALAAVLFLPSFLIWSISLLKESLYFFCTAVFLVMSARALRKQPRWRNRLVGAGAAAAALVAMDSVRSGTLALGLVGLTIAVAALFVFRRGRLSAALVVLFCAAMLLLLTREPMQRRVIAVIENAAKIHAGHVYTVGHAYKVLDEGFYYRPQDRDSSTLTLTGDQATRFVLRALASFVTTPLPWQAVSLRELAYVPEQLVWYGLVVLLPAGAIAGWKRDPVLTLIFVGYVVSTGLALAVTNGNVGTLVRLRGMLMVIVVWMSAVGLCDGLQWISVRTSRGNLLRRVTE
jgi:hypothetical protein